MRRWIAIAVVAVSGTATAGPLGDAISRHADADVATLRAQTTDPAARCTLGAVYARRNDLPRAALYLAGCDQAELPDDVAASITRAARDVRHRLDQSSFAKLEILSRPEGLAASIDALPDEPLTTPATVWVAPGAHTIRVQAVERTLVAQPRKDALVMIETGKPAPPRTRTIDLAQDDTSGSLGEEHTAPPPDIKHPSMIKGKYAGEAGPAAEGPIDDPLAGRNAGPLAGRNAARSSRAFGLRFGAGVFDDGAAAARAGVAIALAARIPVLASWDQAFIAVRADWSRRGGDVMPGGDDPINVLGASVGAGVNVVGPLAVIGQLRGDLRLASSRRDDPVHRVGLSFATGAELAIPGTPLTAGLRLEQGLTPIVPGARDRAALLELGLDLR